MTDATIAPAVHRIEVRPNRDQPDPLAHAARDALRQTFGHAATMHTARVFLIQAPLNEQDALRIGDELLADPVSQYAIAGTDDLPDSGGVVEVHYKPGVMDPVAQSARDAILEMMPDLPPDSVQVRTGVRYDIASGAADAEALQQFARRALANPVIQDIYVEPYHPESFIAGSPYELHVTHVPMRDLDDDGLAKLSREGHLFLSLEEMRAVRDYYRNADREPTDIELETLAQTWSEHCVHKTLKSTVQYTGDPIPNLDENRAGHTCMPDGTVIIDNLLKSTIAAATKELTAEGELADWCISVFVDNAGIVKFDDEHGVCIKVETHNHPSAIEPYGGAATGIGGCIRDVIGTGLAAQPIANTDVFCVAPPAPGSELPNGVIHPRRILEQVVAGVRDYGNRMGIPTVNGAVWFHDDYIGNPLVFCGCIGVMPLDKCFGDPRPGDRIIALGGRTGRDGIHGATFSSAELTDTHADEFSHAVQIGNAITEKKMLDVILQARDHAPSGGGCLFSSITDCGAGGFSSAVGEMGEKVGAHVTLETAPLKYDGLSYTEIWISEAQERMVLAVPPENVEQLRSLCESEDVEMCDLGTFGNLDGDAPMLDLTYKGQHVGRLAMQLLHEGIPTPTREASYKLQVGKLQVEDGKTSSAAENLKLETLQLETRLQALLSHPNIASKHWIIRQYDHEVQGGSAVKPLVGPAQDGPADASVVRPKLTTDRGVAIGCGLQTGMSADAYWMTLAAIDEAVRNLVCVGADPTRIALLDNFCWPGCDKPQNLGSLVRAAEACYDGAMAYRTPFVSGKDSLNNQFTTDDGRVIAIPPTLLITALGIVHDVKHCRTMDAKQPGNVLILVGETTKDMGGSHYAMQFDANANLPHVDLARGPATAQTVAHLIADGRVASAHDCSDGGLLVAAAEMAFAGRVGLDLDLSAAPGIDLDVTATCFAETPSRYLLEVAPQHFDAVIRTLDSAGIPYGQVGMFAKHHALTARTAAEGRILEADLDALRAAWLKPLDW